MINLFNQQYKEEIEVLQEEDVIYLTCYKEGFQIRAYKDGDYLYIKDEHHTHWAYAEISWTIKTPGFYCENLPIGTHIVHGLDRNQTFIRVATQKEIVEKIEKYIKPYIIQHIWNKNIYTINMN